MATTIKASSLFCSSLPKRTISASSTKAHKIPIQNSHFSVSSLQINHHVDELKLDISETTSIKVVKEMYAIKEAVSDRVEMHKNIGEQRNNWNQLLLTSVNGMITTAATMAVLAAMAGLIGALLLALKSSSTLLYISATGILMIMNKIQSSQLAEEQMNASRLFKQLHEELRTTIALKKLTSKGVEIAMEKVLALDKAYPLPLIGSMLEKFPKFVDPTTWWPKHVESQHPLKRSSKVLENGWDEMLEEEVKKVVGWIKKKGEEDYVRLAKIALKLNKILAIYGPLFTGLASIGSAFIGNCPIWPVFLAVVCGVVAMVVNTIVLRFHTLVMDRHVMTIGLGPLSPDHGLGP